MRRVLGGAVLQSAGVVGVASLDLELDALVLAETSGGGASRRGRSGLRHDDCWVRFGGG